MLIDPEINRRFFIEFEPLCIDVKFLLNVPNLSSWLEILFFYINCKFMEVEISV